MKAPLLRYHGGKWRIAPWVIENLPQHQVYVEPFGGAAGVLLRKERAEAEVYNDLDDDIVNLFRIVRDPETASKLADLCALTPYARSELKLSNEPTDNPLEQARRTLFRAWASFGSAGATRGRTGFRTFTRPDKRYSEVANSWGRVSTIIAEVTDRFRDVIIENRDAIEVMQQHDHPRTLHYVDPPYVPETRAFDGGKYYRHEMTLEQHEHLIHQIKNLSGMVVISGYRSDLYDCELSEWMRLEKPTTACGQAGSVKRTECLWLNPATVATRQQMELFA